MGLSSGQFFAKSSDIINDTGIEINALFASIYFLAAIPISPFAKTAGYSISSPKTAPFSTSHSLKATCFASFKAS